MTDTTRRDLGRLALALPVAATLAGARVARGAETVKIGVLYPLSGGAASAGEASKVAQEVAIDIINTAHPDLAPLTLAKDAGLPGLGGAKIEAIFADHQGNPSVAQSQALRLVTQDKVAALIGCYQSSCTLTASAIAERYGIPFMAPESSAPSLTERGFKWFFRTTPVGTDFGAAYANFLSGLGGGARVKKVGLVHENTEYGVSTGKAIMDALKAKSLTIDPVISYPANGTDVSAQVLQLKSASPDAVIFVSYTSDSILFMKTMKNLGYKPPVLIGDDSGFSDNAFITAVGDVAEGVINRSSLDISKSGTLSYKVNELYKKRAGHDLDDTSGRSMVGMFVLADAINRAGSTDPAKVQAALQATNIPADQLMIGYDGVKFGPNGQNTEAATLLVQLRDRKYVSIWPAGKAANEPALPFKGWG